MSNTSKIKYLLKYLYSIITWALLVILIGIALLLGYYFISSRVGSKKPAFSIYTIVSPSMVPNIKVYDVIVNVNIDSPADIQVGDIITFTSTSSISYGMTVTHRVKDIQIVNGEYQYITKGDNNTSQDGSPALYSNVIGRTVLRLPQLGRAQLFIGSKLGWVVCIILPALYIIISDVFKLIKLTKVKNNADRVNKQIQQDNYYNQNNNMNTNNNYNSYNNYSNYNNINYNNMNGGPNGS